ncbi:signal transducer and activator of transcription 2 isoform X2 [Protobothrops mucrosquamatus]|uniref:signal transducer and activator of transcription 2 isoform X2 n=1 Tax=Protobothrops mucrosquamatus TaxID=103944 RepID=UPI000775B753|nr:signal transducer and activator of transcription 2 isoform X2 [Protobothrops mucrosquamatus]
MSQWQRIQMLDKSHMNQIDCLYSDDCLPMEVRQYLAYWIEEQNWSQAVELDPSQASYLFHTMLSLLDDQIGRLALGEEKSANMLLKHNLRRSKLHLQSKYQDHPQELAIAIDALLRQERAILSEAFAASQASVDPPRDPPMPTAQHKIEERLMEIRKTIQGLKCSIEQHGDLQDNFDFCFRTHSHLESTTPASEPQRTRTINKLQSMLNNLDRFRQDMLDQICELLGRSATLRDLLLEEVAAWQMRQRLACIGQKCDTSLGRLEEWFTNSAEILFHLLQLLRMLNGMYEKVTYLTDPFNSRLPPLLKTLQEQIICLLKSAFVVEVQPKMQVPNQRPLVLRTSHKFSVRARLLVKLLDRNNSVEVTIAIDRDATNLTGFRKFNILTSNTKSLMMDNQKQGLVCDFKYISLREQKISGAGKGNKGISEGSLSVTEELHIITFTLDYCYEGIKCQLQTSTLPVVIVSNANQISSAWASILWFIILSTDAKNQLFFSKPPPATWIQLSTVLSWQFSAATERGLDNQQLKMLGEKLCGPGVNSDSTITWDKFSKEATASSPEDNNFSFWTWVDGILFLIQEHLLQLWNDNLIMGFVSRKHEKRLLKKKRAGTFLIRFSESTANGGITCTWVDFNNEGAPECQSVEPYTRKELEFLSLPDIIRDYQLLAKEVIPENPLLYLYPDKPRDEAFCSYYKERREVSTMEQRRYLNRRLIRVSTQPGETQTPDTKELLPISNESVADELENPEYKVEDLLIAKEDPFLFQSNEEQQPLQESFNLHEIPQLHVNDPVFQCLLPLENTSTGISGNDIEDLMNLYAKL